MTPRHTLSVVSKKKKLARRGNRWRINSKVSGSTITSWHISVKALFILDFKYLKKFFTQSLF
jgi:hypothetical protein